MKYVFFDIECACVYINVDKFCVFGYCVADDQFNLLAKPDILINPNGNFHLTYTRAHCIVLPSYYADLKTLPVSKTV